MRIVCVVLAMLMSVMAQAAPSWQPGRIHRHTDFSDGFQTPTQVIQQAIDMKCAFLVVTDHYEQIGSPQSIITKANKEWGFEKYRQALQGRDGLIVFAGAEIQTPWEDKKVKDVASHTLALRESGIFEIPEISDVQGKLGAQQELINNLNKNGYLTIAAHPSNRMIFKNRLWEPFAYPYDKDHAENICGIEFFNESPKEYVQTREWYLRLLAAGKDVFVTGGWDAHTGLESPKITNVFAEKTKKAILDAIGNGHTYAAQNGCWFKSLNLIPGFQAQSVERPTLSCKIGFAATSDPTTIRVYRDGKLVVESVKSIFGGQGEFDYQWTDESASIGEHNYVIEIENYLITSPIKLKITSQSKLNSTDYAGGPSILLGKTRAEIEQMYGSKYGWLTYAKNTYVYHEYPTKYYDTWINFWPYEQGGTFLSRTSYNQVRSVILCFVYYPAQIQNGLRPDQVVPAEILNRKPSGVYRSALSNTIIVMWYMGKKTFVLALCDGSNRPLYTTVKTNKGKTKYYTNKNTFDFHHGYVYHFAYVDAIVKLKENTEMFSNDKYLSFLIDATAHSGFSLFPFN